MQLMNYDGKSIPKHNVYSKSQYDGLALQEN